MKIKIKKKHRSKIYKVIRNFVDPLISKDKKKITLFASTGVIDANLACIKSYIENNHPDYKVNTILGKEKLGFKKARENICHFLTSRYIVVDHAIPRFISNRNRRIFNVWHGIPLKTIRHLDNDRFNNRFLDFESKNLDGLTCSSDLDRAVMAACFNVSPNVCKLTGLPRADILYPGDLEWYQDPQEAELICNLSGKRLVAWMPTYRGTWHENNLIEGFSYEEEKQLCSLLKRNNAVFGIRPHKFSRLQEFPQLSKEGLLVDLSTYKVTNTVLKHTHHLITDYSSVWLDFSLVSSRISLYLFDKGDYDIDRGMVYPLDEVFPGQISVSFDELKNDIEEKLTVKQACHSPSKLFFKFHDNQNTKRFVQALLDEK